MELFVTIVLLMLYAIIFNTISLSASSGILYLTNDPLFLFITECIVSTIDLLLYSSGKCLFILFLLFPLVRYIPKSPFLSGITAKRPCSGNNVVFFLNHNHLSSMMVLNLPTISLSIFSMSSRTSLNHENLPEIYVI